VRDYVWKNFYPEDPSSNPADGPKIKVSKNKFQLTQTHSYRYSTKKEAKKKKSSMRKGGKRLIKVSGMGGKVEHE
jgi:hypothetical protein